MPAASGAGFAFVPAFHNEELDASGGLVIRPMHTPGHTPEHTSYLLLVDGEEHAVFTGGSLLVGSAGRSDLLGFQYAHQLARLQFGSLQRLGELPDPTGVFPTHGEGSFCTASGAGRTTSTIGQEKAENPLYQIDEVEAFVENQLSALVPYPRYYAHMGPTNKQNPTAVHIEPPRELSPIDVDNEITRGAAVLDGRDRKAFAAGHIRGALGIELSDSFAPWAGWLLDYNAPLVLVLDDDQDAVAAATELARVGYVDVRGVLRGTEAWVDSGRTLAGYENATHHELIAAMQTDNPPQVIDVRDPLERAAGHIPGSHHRYLADLPAGLPEGIDLSAPIWIICASGSRASIAAGLVERHGATPVVVASGGVSEILAAS
jgi:rhodanese-related sulfurtransferase